MPLMVIPFYIAVYTKISFLANFILTFCAYCDIINQLKIQVYDCDMGKRFYRPPRMVDYLNY